MNEQCQQIQEHLAAYLYEDIPDEVAQHLENCSNCQQQWQMLQATHREISNLLPQPDDSLVAELQNTLRQTLQPTTPRGILRQIPWWSMAAGILLFLCGMWVGQQRQTTTIQVANEQKVTPPPISKPDPLPAVSRLSWLSPQGLQILEYGTQGKIEASRK